LIGERQVRVLHVDPKGAASRAHLPVRHEETKKVLVPMQCAPNHSFLRSPHACESLSDMCARRQDDLILSINGVSVVSHDGLSEIVR
jgi:hypothetical protein